LINRVEKLKGKKILLFGSMVVIVFQSVFHAKMHQNDIFLKLFLKSAYQNNPKYKKN
jgi:hypothetical protein